jgi:hypothetical protein
LPAKSLFDNISIFDLFRPFRLIFRRWCFVWIHGRSRQACDVAPEWKDSREAAKVDSHRRKPVVSCETRAVVSREAAKGRGA